jgi:hypothetical protein
MIEFVVDTRSLPVSMRATYATLTWGLKIFSFSPSNSEKVQSVKMYQLIPTLIRQDDFYENRFNSQNDISKICFSSKFFYKQEWARESKNCLDQSEFNSSFDRSRVSNQVDINYNQASFADYQDNQHFSNQETQIINLHSLINISIKSQIIQQPK